MKRIIVSALLSMLCLSVHAGQIYSGAQCTTIAGWDTYANLVVDKPAYNNICAEFWTADKGYTYSDGTNWILPNAGTVTSVDMTVPSGFSISGNPITASGALALGFASGQTANRFLATPNGSSGSLGLRAVAAADLPSTITSNTSGNAATATQATSALALASTPTQCSAGSFATGITTVGNANCSTPTTTSPDFSAPNSRTLSLATAYQATNTAKAAMVTVNLTSTATLSLSGGTTNSATVVIGSTSAVASGTGTVIDNYSNTNTGALTVGLNLSTVSAVPMTFALPKGWFFAILQTNGTVTITSAFDQAVG